MSVGTSYLQVLRSAIRRGDTDARRALEAVEAVLEGRARQAVLEYACPSGDGARWFEMAVEPFRRPQGGAIISHVDITQRRRAEEEARRQREELAHALRVTTMGELAGSLAHEINQPLAVIVTSAQAAQRLLDRGRPDRAELRGALTDIADQGKHAAQVIGRLRALFRKTESELQLLDVGELVTGMASLVRHDVERRGIAMTLDCPSRLPSVSGDSIQLQQVVLNLLVNACEAMSTVDGPKRSDRRDPRAPGSGHRADDQRYRPRPEGVGGRAHLRALRHHQGRRARHGSVDQPVDHRRARWTDLGDLQPRPGDHGSRRVAVRAGPRGIGPRSYRAVRSSALRSSETRDGDFSLMVLSETRAATACVVQQPLVCVVDDDTAMLRALRLLIATSGFSVEGTPQRRRPSGPRAWPTVDCLVVDVHLGAVSGLDLHEGLVRSGSPIPVIFITAFDDGPTRERARRSGAVEYLTKPFDEGALIDAIRRAIGRT